MAPVGTVWDKRGFFASHLTFDWPSFGPKRAMKWAILLSWIHNLLVCLGIQSCSLGYPVLCGGYPVVDRNSVSVSKKNIFIQWIFNPFSSG